MDKPFWDIMMKRKVKALPSPGASTVSDRSNDDLEKVNLGALHISDAKAANSSITSTSNSTETNANIYDYAISDVVIVGAGPSGLMLAANLVRFGIKVEVVDNRPGRTSAGRADGVQPKLIETFRQMRLAEPILRKGVKVYDTTYWKSTYERSLHRSGREEHYPADIVDLVDPYLLLVHQGMIEDILLDDLKERGIRVRRNTAFVDFDYASGGACDIKVNCKANVEQTKRVLSTHYLVGCDGAHSRVRRAMPGCSTVGSSSEAIWGVLDGELRTDFPDVWNKVTINSDAFGSILLFPRERNLTRFYVEMKSDTCKDLTPLKDLTEEFVMARGREIMRPYSLNWKSIEWFGRYKVGQRVASHFMDDSKHVLIAGDASHTHSPKSSQGMNTSMHDSWNLAWKLNLVIRGLGKPELLDTYESERRKIAQDLINFDYEYANAVSAGDPEALSENVRKNIRFISGVGAEYEFNVLNIPSKAMVQGTLKPGCLLPPAAVTRFVDSNPVQMQDDIPALGQFRMYFFCHDLHAANPFLDTIDIHHRSQRTFVGSLTNAANASYMLQPPLAAPHDAFVRPERYTPVTSLFTYALVTDMPKSSVETADLPSIFRDSRWTFYLDDCPESDTRKQTCMDKWLGGLGQDEVVIVNVRPDGYVGSLRRFPGGSRECAEEAIWWLDDYYAGFLKL